MKCFLFAVLIALLSATPLISAPTGTDPINPRVLSGRCIHGQGQRLMLRFLSKFLLKPFCIVEIRRYFLKSHRVEMIPVDFGA